MTPRDPARGRAARSEALKVSGQACSGRELPAALRGLVPAQKSGPGKGDRRRVPQGLFGRLADVYRRMEDAYATCAASAGLTCEGCSTNCCVSYFQHHTYVEWIYLWKGLAALPSARRENFVERAREYVEHARSARAAGVLPSRMCPLNESGLCALYTHRLMICRMHGTRNVLVLPDGNQRVFPGCARFTSLPRAVDDEASTLDRTPFYRELAALEMELYQRVRNTRLPKVDLTLAEMIVLGPPEIGAGPL